MSVRQSLFPLLRAMFRALPLPQAQRDRLRTRLLARHGDWVPPPPKGQQAEGGTGASAQLRWRADEPAIGHVPWREATLPSPLPATLVAFYLPQFHTFPENDAWWGKGFTEWRNVTRALPQFEGHVQPRLPADLGFYDLRNPQVMRDQARLAAEYGIGAFCFYYYWFSGRTLMEDPLRQWLADDSIELPFCLCWANENWARRWDGRDEDILIGQQHSAEDDLAFIAHVAPYLRDRRALKVEGRPMLLVYRPHLLPDARATTERWRRWCRDNGVGEIHLAYVQGFERPDPRDIGFDAAVEFPPNMSNPRSLSAQQWLLNPAFNGDVRDWRELATEIASRPLPDYPLYPGVNPGWDNEARRSGRGRVYLHASPRGYRDWLRTTIHERLSAAPQAQRMVFINAWNEWAEGAVLEPDARLGHAWLQATRDALAPAPALRQKPAVHLHAWYLETLPEVLSALREAALDWTIVVTTPAQQVDLARQALVAHGLQGEVIAVDNHGRDILPFLEVSERLLQADHDVVLKLHTKRSTHRADGDQWRQELLQRLVQGGRAARIHAAFQADPALGMVVAEGHLLPVAAFVGGNGPALARLQARLGLETPEDASQFGAGSMGWWRLQALRPLLDAHLHRSAFEDEKGQIDGTLAHAIERVLGACCEHAGLRVTTAAACLGEADASSDEYAYARRS
ncbi:glycoside hydrolase family 99-like domain-containing protein [Stenotrophomonas geniculata]|uniref:glycoside hydrolase family 99-like domain-containing protein n=1 Tax=Stenotrophomonas TaxID=40323 RepID=UPI002097C16F|nr:glycoside hydrolase family 99-like domain-containing protein [Stenotrophomonas maltophilia]MCO7460659.1 glycoside hydrolase family 99-like domain-containing protein [Stenotrophomonas maltophilia]